jgi:RHS repeat-associated protein
MRSTAIERVFAILSCSVVSLLLAIRAQAQFTDILPPSVGVSPTAGTVTSNSLAFTLDWCDDHSLVTHSITWNGTDVTASMTYVSATPNGTSCAIHKQSTGSLTALPGSNTLVVSDRDGAGHTGGGTRTYRYTAVSVSPVTATLDRPQRTTQTDTFSVHNLLNTSQTFDLQAICSGQLTACAAPSSITVAALATNLVSVSYLTDTVSTSGTITFKAWLSTNTALRDSGSVTIIAQPSLTADFTFNNNDTQDRQLCALGCFEANTQVSTVPYVSMGVNRAAQLAYRGERVSVRPFVYADVSIPSRAVTPTEFWIQVKDSVSGAFLPFTNGDVSKIRYVGTALPVRLIAQVDASQYATSMRSVYVIVTAHRAAYDETSTYLTKLIIVNERTSPIARGWTVAGLQRAYFQPDGSALITDGNGSAVYFPGSCFVIVGVCTFSAPTNEYSRFKLASISGPNIFVREYVDSTKAYFRASGLVDSVVDRFGNAVRYEYDGSNRLTKIYDPFRTYNAGASRSYIAFSYGSYGLTKIQEPGADGSPIGGRASLVKVASDSTLLSFTDPDGDSTRFSYDASRRLQTSTDRAGNVGSLAYDVNSWKITSESAPQISVDAGGGGTTLATPRSTMRPWQLVGLPQSTTSGTAAMPVRADTIRARVVDAAGNLTTYTADRWGQPLVVTDPLGRQTTFSRAGLLDTMVTHVSGAIDKIRYGFGSPLPSFVKPFNADTTYYSYGAYGQVTKVSGPHQPTVTSYLGPQGRVDSVSFGSSNFMTRYTYDGSGRATRVVDPGNDELSYHYDSKFGNLDSAAAPGNRFTRVRFDGRGRDSSSFSLGGTTTVTLYDSLGRTRQVSDSVHGSTLFGYDKLHLIRVQDPKGQIYRFDVNALGWTTREYDPADTLNRYQSYRYRADGTLTSRTNRRGQRLDFVFDSAGRLISKKGPSNVVADSFSYNLAGTIKSSQNVVSRDSIFLDNRGWTDSVVSRLATDFSIRFHRTYSHDTQYRLTTLAMDTAGGMSFPQRTWTWNAGTGLLSSFAVGSKSIAFRYGNEGQRDTTTWESSLTRTDVYSTIHTLGTSSYSSTTVDAAFWRTYAPDSLGRTSQELRRNGTGSLIHKFAYTPKSELRRFEELTTTGAVDNCSGIGLKNDYGYSCISPPGVVQSQLHGFAYDSAGNLRLDRDSIAAQSKTGTFNTGNRLSSWNGTPYVFDVDGNLQRRRSGADSVRFFWSADGRLDSVNSQGLRVHYEYNALGEVVRKSRNGVVDRHLLWDRGQLLAEFNNALTARIAEYAYYRGVDQPTALLTGAQTVNATRYHQQDAFGNVIGISTLSSVSQQVDYDPWGNASILIGTAMADTNRLRWKGLAWEGDSTQLYYVRNRWYDPAARRFVSEDPSGLSGGVNKYVFAQNEPVDGSDPSGLCSQWAFKPNDGYKGDPAEGEGKWVCTAEGGSDDTSPGVGVGTEVDKDPYANYHLPEVVVVGSSDPTNVLEPVVVTSPDVNVLPSTTGAFSGTFILPVWMLAGPAFTGSYAPKEGVVCLGGGAGIAVGRSIGGGFVGVHGWGGSTIKDVLGGWSLSGGYNWTPWKGVQGSINLSGFTLGAAHGSPGGSGAVTYSKCWGGG